MKTKTQTVRGRLRHDWLFIATLVIFACETTWLALTSILGMAFDESWHFELIKFFSGRLNPVVSVQPANTFYLGAIKHNPSFLYHYLLSFPYRLVAHFSSSLQVQVISLRLINIAFAIVGLVLIRQVLRQLRVARMLADLIVLVFAFTPIFSVLSAQINYDNLMIPCLAGSILLLLKFVERLNAGQFDWWLFGSQWCLLIFTSLIKFEALPVMAAVAIVEAWFIWRFRQAQGRQFLARIGDSFKQLRRAQLVVLAVAALIGGGLFTDFYVRDTVVYHNPNPSCDQLLSMQACQKNDIWVRNYTLAAHRGPASGLMGPLRYSLLWFKVSSGQLFAETVPFGGGQVPMDRTFYLVVMATLFVATISALSQAKFIFQRHKQLSIVLFITLFYALWLWARNYHDYHHMGAPMGVQGRYMLPVLLYIYGFLALGVWYSLNSPRRLITFSRNMLAVEMVAVFVYFGGFSRYASSVSPTMKWQPTASAPVSANHIEVSTRI